MYERFINIKYIIDIGSFYVIEWKVMIDDCGVELRYIYVFGDENLFIIRSNVILMMIICL